MTWLVTGGAGYIGSHVARALLEAGHSVVIVDDLSTGRESFVPSGAVFVRGSILDGALLSETMAEHSVTGVIHVAGYKYAGVSVERPLHAYRQNVTGTLTLLAAMEDRKVEKIVFSSSASVYGTPASDRVTEASAKHPESPYGETKLIGEWLLADQGRARGLRHTSLRYFNVVGSGVGGAPDLSPHNLFPMVFESLREGRVPRINGTDYPTPDGTCIRDYIHVADLAAAHVAAAEGLVDGSVGEQAYNLGSGTGYSVAQIMAAIAEATGIEFTPVHGPRRAGDPARIVASGELAARDLGWAMRYSLEEMVGSAWLARQNLEP